jgi:hypothetical protein
LSQFCIRLIISDDYNEVRRGKALKTPK